METTTTETYEIKTRRVAAGKLRAGDLLFPDPLGDRFVVLADVDKSQFTDRVTVRWVADGRIWTADLTAAQEVTVGR